MAIILTVESHPLLQLAAIRCRFSAPLGSGDSPPWLTDLLSGETSGHRRSEDGRVAIRKMLRHGGYRPSGRGKPASEYLVAAAGRQALSSINPAVDALNAASLHGGVPISAIDLDSVEGGLGVRVCGANESYIFNSAGQEIDLEGLLCLHDAHGPCANAVKDSQRTKTGPETTDLLGVIWGSGEAPQELANTRDCLGDLWGKLGGELEEVEVVSEG